MRASRKFFGERAQRSVAERRSGGALAIGIGAKASYAAAWARSVGLVSRGSGGFAAGLLSTSASGKKKQGQRHGECRWQ